MIGLKVKGTEKFAKAIAIIRKFDGSLSMNEIKKKVENDEIVLFHDISENTDICDELNGVDKNKLFCNLVQDLEKADIAIELYDDDELITKEMLHNMMESWQQISDATELDIQRELGIMK